jgi:uncharacterized protein UPF0175
VEIEVQTVTLDDELAAILRAENRSLEAAAREALVLELFRRGRLSIGKACELLSENREAFGGPARIRADSALPQPNSAAALPSVEFERPFQGGWF